MVTLLSVCLLALGGLPLLLALVRRRPGDPTRSRRAVARGSIILGTTIAVLVLWNAAVSITVDAWWFGAAGYAGRFWAELTTRAGLFVGAGLLAALVSVLASWLVSGDRPPVRGRIAAVFGGLFFGVLASNWWLEVLMALHGTEGAFRDPLFGRSVGFYLFRFPLLWHAAGWVLAMLLYAGFTAVISTAGSVSLDNPQRARESLSRSGTGLTRGILMVGGLLLCVLAVRAWLSRFALLHGQDGAVIGAGYVDAHFRVLGFWVAAVVQALLGLAAILASVVPAFAARALGITYGSRVRVRPRLAVIAGTAVLLMIVFQGLLPGFIQAVRVRPNEITLERPYLEHCIAFTRQAYRLHRDVTVRNQPSVGRVIGEDVAEANRPTLDNVRLWDPRALMDNMREQQEIRLYYEFNDVDIDRYHLDGEYRQVMLAVREVAKDQLDPRSQTWVSRQLKYTHGYGMVVLPVHEAGPQGKPRLLVRDIPPNASLERLQVKQPEVYYGERTVDEVYVGTTEQQFDYPSDTANVYTDYDGTGGVSIGSFWRRFMLAWFFDDYRLVLSGYFTRDSRALFRRHILQRIHTLAPFLITDRDPYAVLTREGRQVYIVDCYTVSHRYPYAERYAGRIGRFAGRNYVRNAVKVTVDAYDGTVRLYVTDPDDPIIQTLRKVFPDLFLPMARMPDDIRAHIRYPEDFLTAQAEMYATYHMQDPEAYYQREDVWQFATERYREAFQSVDPYYVMLKLEGDGDGDLQFALINPFTPRNKNVLNAWMAGLCDGDSYGKLVVFTYPKGVEVLGPRQIEARIDQNTEMSKAMSLWGQRGSEVLRGNLLSIPLFRHDTLFMLYAEPIYLQAEDARMPELKRVALADQKRVVWGPDFESALHKLVRRRPVGNAEPTTVGDATGKSETDWQGDARRALARLRAYRRRSGSGDYQTAGTALGELENILQRASRETHTAPGDGIADSGTITQEHERGDIAAEDIHQ